MANKYELSMSPIKVGNITLKNRYVAGSVTGRFLLYGLYGEYSPNGVEFEVSHARGGFGLIVTGSNYGDQTVDPFNPLNDKPSPLYAPKVSGHSFSTVTRRAHEYGSKIFMQIAFGPGRMRNGKSCSELPTLLNPAKKTAALTVEEIERLLSEAIRLAKYAKTNGFDGVEIHAHFGYLLDQFQMACTNLRTDEYGGDLEGRLTVYRKLIRGIKETCGEDFPVAIRMGLKTYMKSFTEASLDGKDDIGRDIDETVEVAKLLESYGIDMFDLNSGTYESHYYCLNPYYMPKGYNIKLARKVKEAVNVPVFCVGLMDDVDMCEKALQDGDIDGITICRAALVDTQYARKVRENRVEDIRPCIQCGTCEHANLTVGLPLCAANPAAMQEFSYGIPKTQRAKKVAVIGSGIAGLVAAHTAATAGHEVSVYEKAPKIGGHLIEIGAQSFKKGVADLNAWYQRELCKLGVTVHVNSEMTAEKVKALGVNIVLLAQGSHYATPAIEGIDNAKVVYAPDVMLGTAQVGETVAVIGGGCVGGEIAFDLSGYGKKKVTLIEQGPSVVAGKLLTDDVRQMLTELLPYTGVSVKTGTKAVAVTDEGVVIDCGGETSVIKADTVVVATGAKPSSTLYDELVGCGIELFEIGDCTGVGTIQKATAQAYEIARGL